MALRRTFQRAVRDRAARDPRFRKALLEEGLDALLAGDLPGMRTAIRTYVNATLGFGRLARQTGISDKSLMRMLGRNGNPRAGHLGVLLRALAEHEGVFFSARVGEPGQEPDR